MTMPNITQHIAQLLSKGRQDQDIAAKNASDVILTDVSKGLKLGDSNDSGHDGVRSCFEDRNEHDVGFTVYGHADLQATLVGNIMRSCNASVDQYTDGGNDCPENFFKSYGYCPGKTLGFWMQLDLHIEDFHGNPIVADPCIVEQINWMCSSSGLNGSYGTPAEIARDQANADALNSAKLEKIMAGSLVGVAAAVVLGYAACRLFSRCSPLDDEQQHDNRSEASPPSYAYASSVSP